MNKKNYVVYYTTLEGVNSLQRKNRCIAPFCVHVGAGMYKVHFSL
jgi:hypothetical protein